MDEYDKKFAEMQKYIPFLEAMIERLQNVKDKSREIQLQKMQSLHGILSNSKRKLKIETLQRCEDVLQKLHSKVEKGNTPGLQLSTKQNDASMLHSSTSLEDGKSDQNNKGDQLSQNEKKVVEIEETPASPDPGGVSSPDCQILPIIIPTERNIDLRQEKSSRRQQHKSKIIPIITLTDHPGNTSSPADFNSDDVVFTEWDMLEESERHNAKNKITWQSTTSDNDVAIAAKLVSNNLPQKINDGSRNYTLGSRSVPVPSRFTSVLEKNKLNLNISGESSSRPESPVNVPEVRLNSPDPEIMFAKPRIVSPRSKDHNVPKSLSKPPSIPLLLSPPASNKPSLSVEDLAKLLNDDSEAEKRGDKDEDAAKHKTDSGSKQETNLASKDGKATKNFSSDADRENEKRWEEINSHNVTFATKKSTPNIGGISVIRMNELKRSNQPNDHRSASQASSPSSKLQEPRYADNYEKHPRQRDIHEKDTLAVSIITEMPQIHQSLANKPDERNVPLYQRRPSVPVEGWKETGPARSENEFVIEGMDYYNMHLNQMHWPPSATIGENQFTNTPQWTSPVYGGMSNPSLQQPPPTQHPYPHPMESQFRSGPFPPNLPAGPRPLISSAVRTQDMNHVARPENIREDVSLRSASGFSVTPQYRGYQVGQGSYDPAFDRPSTEYSHVRSSWGDSVNRGPGQEVTYENIPCGIQVAENSAISYSRPNTPCPWGSRDRDRCNRGRGRDGYYNERNRTEARPNFNREIRRSDWPRDGHSDRENPPNRFVNRDPRVRTEHNVTSSNQAKETSGSVRDPRLAKDKHVNAPNKAKDVAQNERDPRKRPPSFNSTVKSTTSIKEKSKLQKSDKESEKEKEKLPKDRMQSPLESLYGAIDTKSQGSGLQKFRIPKIKRSEPLQPSYNANESKGSGSVSSKLLHTKNHSKKSSSNSHLESIGKEDTTNAEVSSSSDSSHTTENLIQLKQTAISTAFVEETNKNEIKVGEADSVTSDPKSNDVAIDKSKKDESEADGGGKPKELTQEWIETLIRKSFESGEGKKLVEQAKLIQKLGEALKAKKFKKKFKKIIDSESESSNSDKEASETKKTQTKKKRRVIVSDSSDDECLAERLGILNTNIDASEKTESIPVTCTGSAESPKENLESTAASNNLRASDEPLEDSSKNRDHLQADDNNKSTDMQVENDRLGHNNEKTDTRLESDKQIDNSLNVEDNDRKKTQAEDKHDRTDEKSNSSSGTESSLDLNKTPAECMKPIVPSTANDRTDEIADDKPKVKTKRRNSLEMLQEDIREMFISEGVVMATGYRMCRMSREASGVNAPLNNLKKDETLSTLNKKETNSEADDSTNSKIKKVPRTNKSKAKNKKDIKRTGRNSHSKESIPNSDSEEDQPLALRTEKLLSSTGNSIADQEDNQDEESCDASRRSKRVLHKDSIKESRVLVEKADIPKIDSSKVMFDSSSDESFGIDVSELAAAVDISPQPISNQEKQSDQDSLDTETNSKRSRNVKNNKSSNNIKQKKSFNADDKNEDGISLTDEESVMSDVSMSSSTIVEKRTSGGSARTSTREELLSNILVGLVPTTTEKNSSKGTEADLGDDDTNEPVAIETSVKKSTAKKKKKRSSWQMGIVTTKKKKKKTASASDSLKISQANIEETNETTTSVNVVEDNRTIAEDGSVAAVSEETKSSIEKYLVDASVDPEDFKTSCDVKPLVTDTKLSNFAALSESSNLGRESFSDESLFSFEESKSVIKNEKEIEEAETVKNIVAAPSSTDTTTTTSSFMKSSEVVYDEALAETFRKMSIDQLIDYVWTGQDKYKCLLCIFTGKNIVHHYKMNHAGREVLIARLKLADAETAIADAESDRTRPTETTMTTLNEVCKFRCRFCCFVTEGAADVAIEAFYEHCTTHTGEYRFHCNTCPYQAVAKASMRTHYYKMCRKHNDTFSEAASEDDVPKVGGVYGYLCRKCNYVQLKRSNVEAHVAFWHRENRAEILRINMSARTNEAVADTSSNEASQEPSMMPPINTEKPCAVETRLPKLENVDVSDIDIRQTRESQEDNVHEESLEPKLEDSIEIKEEEEAESADKSKLSQGETESLVNTGNLSVFVCPPELENKEVEIQRERQKMMQEVANNIGILLKNFSKPGLSIIDKLQDKMRTDAIGNSIPECSSTNALETIEPPSIVETLESVDNHPVDATQDPLRQSDSQEDRSSSKSEEQPIVSEKSAVADNADNTSKTDTTKIWDPLAIMDPCNNDDENDGEMSDNERTAPVFESDSSSEQSDSESTDVNMILKETSNMSVSSSRDPMLTTIQRLAAQLQSAKPLEPMPENKVEVKREFVSSIPEPPDVVSLVDAARLSKQNAKRMKTRTPEQASLRGCATSLMKSPPKNFLRFRRLSGDMLSMPAQLCADDRQNTRAASADGIQSGRALDSLQTDMEEECSFLKIENVVSLAPKPDSNETESSIINHIRKAVEVPATKVLPMKKSTQPLILKKVIAKNVIPQSLAQGPSAQGHMSQSITSEHVTLLPITNLPASVSTKPDAAHLTSTNFVPISPASKLIPLDSSNKAAFQSVSKTSATSSITLPVAVSSTNPSSNLNYKIFKVVRAPALIKPKDPPTSSVVIKLKSIEAYTRMMKEPKLVHFYKCMSRDCYYTTDSVTLYCQHYHQHYDVVNKQNIVPPHDFQKCAYCYAILSDWTNMKTHLWDKHVHCRYQCAYCFYRALVPSYVQQHQALHHPGNKFRFLLGKLIKPVQTRKNFNRNDFILPFVCNHDCGKVFYIFDLFIAHLRQHPQFLTKGVLYKCHLCATNHKTIELLMSHYKLHGFSKYQCLYCICGAENSSEMHQHLSSFHCNQLPQAIERTFPSPPVHHVNVVDQLAVRTFDDLKQLFIDEESNNLNVDSCQSNASLENVSDDEIPPIPSSNETVLNEEWSSQSKKLTSNFLEKVNDNSNNAEMVNITVTQCKDSSFTAIIENMSDNTAENQLLHGEFTLNKLDENQSLSQSENKTVSVYTANQNFHKRELELLSCMNETSTVDSLTSSTEFSCNDEFVNTNLLDNPEILKNFGVSPSTSFFKDNTIQDNTALEGKTEDSDIEILENIENKKKIMDKNVTEDNRNQTMDPKTWKHSVEEKEEFACDKTDDKCSPESTPTTSANENAQQEKPLTLDDIKDTGLIGVELYKCGYPDCTFAALNASLLRAHMKECSFGMSNKNLFCPHCKKRFVKVGFLLEHLKAHGLKRFGCSQCKVRFAVSYQATAHMKTKHKFPNTKLVPADPTNPSVDGLFVVHAIPFDAAERKSKKRKGARSGMEQEKEKAADNEKLSFNPDEIEQLPRQAIYNREVQCAVCPYTTKVRTNIIRHLQLHAKDETVPETGPVNPVPCLDKKEKMFDKMVNLASSSHQNGRMGGKPKETVKENEQDDGIPKFVPEHKRYVCGVAECNYLTVNEAMLRCHLKALHSEEPYFRCPHCPPPTAGQESQHIIIDKMGVHLKMHDTRLYKCSHCNHHHYHRHVVERHLTDKHPEKRPFVKVIRELENIENVQQSVQEEADEEVPDPDGNHWKCNLCDFKCIYKADITAHAATVHDENSQYKCTLCPFKTSGKCSLLEQHINSKHVYDSNADYITVYQRIKGVNKRNETTEQGGQEEPFDTTPLWRRSMPRIRHIRGILLEEEIETPATSEASSPVASKVSLGKRKSDVDISTKAAKIKLTGKSVSLDENNKQSKEKSKRSLSCEKLCAEAESEEQITKASAPSKVDNKSMKNSKIDTIELTDVNDSDVGRFGPYGKPDGNLYICTLCNHFKTKYKHDMRDHLYRELNYARWHCKACGYLSVNRNALLQHFGKRHNGECPEHEPLSPDNAIEDWVMTLLKKQTDAIKAFQHGKAPNKNIPAPANTSVANPEVSKITSAKRIYVNKRIVNLASVTSNLQNDVPDANKSSIDTDDGDSRDDDLVIDMKEDELLDKSTESENDKYKKTTEILEKPLICKHCQMKFTRLRGFKLHVQLSHLKRLFFLCPYCDRSTNSEPIMRQHIRSKHPNDPEKIVHNPSAWGSVKLTNEFWEKEYGLVFPLKTKKRKLNTNDNNSSDGGGDNGDDDGDGNVTGGSLNTSSNDGNAGKSTSREKCDVCGFTAVNYTGLKSHMRMHGVPKHTLKCSYCTYSCSLKAELLEHSEFNHPSLPLKYQELSAAGFFEAVKKSLSSKKRDVDVYDASKDVEEECVMLDNNPTLTTIYGCFYCNFRHRSLLFIKRHWMTNHKEWKSTENVKINLPFKYKQIHLPISKLTSNNCVKKTIESPRDLMKQSKKQTPVVQWRGWVCQWCEEFCETDNDRITHQNMFHSHLPQNFKKQESRQQQQQQEDQSKSTTQVFTQNIEKHLTLATRLEDDSKCGPVAKSMSQVRRNEMSQSRPSTSKRGSGKAQVARKSTTRPSLFYARPGPRIFKAVARKSTNPLPKYRSDRFASHLTASQLMKTKSEKEETNDSKSDYEISKSPINLSRLNTYMIVGGHSMRVNCHTLATLININPKVMLRDCVINNRKE